MITKEEAQKLVYDQVNIPDLYWPERPEMIVTSVEEHELGWLVYYTSRLWFETKDIRHAIAGNGPYLVSNQDGTMIPVGTSAPLEERIREAALELVARLGGEASNP